MAHPVSFPRHILWAASCGLLWSQRCSSKRKESSWRGGHQRKKEKKLGKKKEDSLCLGNCSVLCPYNTYHCRPKCQAEPVVLHHYLNTQNKFTSPFEGHCRSCSTGGSHNCCHPAACPYHSQAEAAAPLQWHSSLLVLFDTLGSSLHVAFS